MATREEIVAALVQLLVGNEPVKSVPISVTPKLGAPKPRPTPIDPHMLRSRASCPHCGRVGQVAKTFGVRDMGGGRIRVQSWCRDCRRDPKNERALDFAKAKRKAHGHTVGRGRKGGRK